MATEHKTQAKPKRTTHGHTKPRAPSTPLNQPGRLRVANWMALLNVCHSTFTKGVKSGRYPAPDGRDGKFPFWNNSTGMKYLGEGKK